MKNLIYSAIQNIILTKQSSKPEKAKSRGNKENEPSDTNILKEGVYNLFRWAETNNMLFNKNKFKL